ncbi:MAG: (p)ppGpp synthetase [Akkermansiaceae bacterium]|nr:(p)ppGpp synthetase [Akkermansiaceae bacterium]
MSPFEKRQYSGKQIIKAGDLLRHAETLTQQEKEWALSVLDNFRSLHAMPLNTFQATLRKRIEALKISDVIIAQRIKRKPTILDKLQRFEGMQLKRMHDIGGIRVILPNIKKLNALKELYTHSSTRLSHKLVRIDDYISTPKSSGYRGIHLVFSYHTKHPDKQDYEGLRIEMQLRTKLQHIWATAVEIFEAFMGENFKSSKGSQEWLNFFALASSAIALKEKQPVMPAHEALSQDDICRSLMRKVEELGVLKVMDGFTLTDTLTSANAKKSGHVLLVFDAEEKIATVRHYSDHEYDDAYATYVREEGKNAADTAHRHVVLVKMNSIQQLKKAYPNYFASIHRFRELLLQILAPYLNSPTLPQA